MAEIAGLVLGVVPLVISALEHYEEFVEPAIAFFKWKGQLSQVTRRLLMEHTAYVQNLQLLLKRAVGSNDLAEMIEDTKHRLWSSKGLVEALEDDLGQAYRPSMSTIHEMADIMVAISASLNIQGSDKVTQQGLEAVVFANPPLSKTPVLRRRFYFRDRVAFTMKRRAINEKLEQLEKCNSRLYDFLEKAEKIHAISQDGDDPAGRRSRVQFVAPLRSIQGNASKVHQGLRRRWCSEHDCHQAGLLLEQRIVRRKKHRFGTFRNAGKQNQFSVSLWRAAAMVWLDADFRIEDDPATISCASGASIPKITFDIRFGDYQDDKSTSEVESEVEDICLAIESAVQSHVGFSLDSCGVLRGVTGSSRQAYSLADKHITLDEYLPVIKRKECALADFYCLAITLVSSVLQLGETPWLQRPWSRQSIAFIRLRDDAGLSVDVQQPYLTHRYEAEQTAADDTSYTPPPGRLNMLALAVMLIELNSGVPIERLRSDDDLGPDGRPNAGTDLSTAGRWLDAQVRLGNLTCGFASAITCCLQSYLDPTASLEAVEFLQSVQERVLEPLEREMQQLLWG
ncbi:hypothetical protein CPLU01_01724 [Colletotrichum plurivorum]|uniref:DUF7580 domain-containing protein n=1 Tax=Colletotrichum plurivorum TaxID=2175906 RepID=A0A8H6KXP2_9PEZI|nr:hypothetical protein CPLU01_01724 [Colletotrichum plurivorum]